MGYILGLLMGLGTAFSFYALMKHNEHTQKQKEQEMVERLAEELDKRDKK